MSKRPPAHPTKPPTRPSRPTERAGSGREPAENRTPQTAKPRITAPLPQRKPTRPTTVPDAPQRTERPPAGHEAATPLPHGAHWLWGTHAVEAALANPERKILRLVATSETAESLRRKPSDSDSDSALDLPHPADILNREEINRLLPPGAVHQGLALLVKPLKQLVIEDLCDRVTDQETALVLLLDQVTDPHNVGAILRSAAAFGALAVVVPDRNAPDVSGVLAKSASGAVESIPLIRTVNLVRALDLLKKAGFWVVGLDGAAERSLASHNLTGRVALILGGEGDGLRRLTQENCDFVAKLPMKGPIESLNVSNAAAIALYELTRTP